jgi:hypothetical protein
MNQQQKGLNKYGDIMSTDNWTTIQCIEHAQQECLDTLVYLESLKLSLKEIRDATNSKKHET